MEWTVVFNKEVAPLLPVGIILGNLFVAVLILVFGLLIGRALGKFTKKTVAALEISKSLKKAGIKTKPEVIAENIIRYIIYIGAVIIALNQLGITPIVLNIIFAGIIAVILITVFLSLKDFIPNLISGIYLLATHKIQVGYNIKIRDVSGKIIDIDLIETTLKTKAGNKIIIPNSTITKSQITIQKTLK